MLLMPRPQMFPFFFFNDTATTEISPLPLHAALPIWLHEPGVEHPHFGAVLSHLHGSPWAVLGGPIGNTGVSIRHGQSAGFLGTEHEPAFPALDPTTDRKSTRLNSSHSQISYAVLCLE